MKAGIFYITICILSSFAQADTMPPTNNLAVDFSRIIQQHTIERKDTYYVYEWYEKEIKEIDNRLRILPELQKRFHLSSFDLLIVEDHGNINLFSGNDMYYFFFKPIDFSFGYDSHSSTELLTIMIWNVEKELMNAVEVFKKHRTSIAEKERNGNFDKKNSAMQKYGWTVGWRYRYLLMLWPTDDQSYDLFFEYDPCQWGMKGQPYFHHLMKLIRDLIQPWKKEFLLKHKLLPENQMKYHLETGGIA